MNQTIMQRLDEAIDSWPLWQPVLSKRPKVIDQLPGGLTNASWRVETERGLVVVRINSPHDKALNIDRDREEQIHRAAAHAGLAPPILFCDWRRSFLVTEYIVGNNWQPAAFKHPDTQKKLHRLVRRIQAIQLPFARFDYWQHLCHYANYLENHGVFIPDEVRLRKQRYGEKIQAFQQSLWRPVLVHHDLEAGNIIENAEGLWVIDWEYAALGCGGMDVCTDLAEHGKNAAVIAVLQDLLNEYWMLVKNHAYKMSAPSR